MSHSVLHKQSTFASPLRVHIEPNVIGLATSPGKPCLVQHLAVLENLRIRLAYLVISISVLLILSTDDEKMGNFYNVTELIWL